MQTVIRKSMQVLHNLERIFFLALVIFPFALVTGCIQLYLDGFNKQSGQSRAYIKSSKMRWKWFQINGITEIRKIYWVPLCFEPKWVVWHYLFALELFELSNLLNEAIRRECSTQQREILVIRLGHLGDYIQTLPLLQRLQGRTKSVDVLVGVWNQNFAKVVTDDINVIPYSTVLHQFNRNKKRALCEIYKEYKYLCGLRNCRYGVVLSLEGHHLLDFVLRSALHYDKFYAVRQNNDLPLLSRMECESIAYDQRQPEHVWLLSFAKSLGLFSGACSPFIPLDEEKCQESVACVPQSRPYVTISPGAGWSGKCWPQERFVSIGKWLIDHRDMNVLVIGSPGESSLCGQIASGIGRRAVSLAGKTSKIDVCCLLKNAFAHLGNDNGLMHIAAAVGAPTVSLFGPTDPEKWAPSGEQHIFLQHRDACTSSCLPWHPNAMCTGNHACMNAITEEEVIRALTKLLENTFFFNSSL